MTVTPGRGKYFGMNDPEFEKGSTAALSPLSRAMVLLLAVTCGAAVANIYYAQPLLPVISEALGSPTGPEV